MKKLHKSLLIGVGALILSTVAIQASDIVSGVGGNLSSLVIQSEGPCGAGSTLVLLGGHGLCVDTYEASPGSACPNHIIKNAGQTQDNANSALCTVISQKGSSPWNYVSLTQAQQLCARSGKRLPTNLEWYKIVSGQVDQANCIVNSKKSEPSDTGSTNCVTPSGIYDMVGNVWEWVDGEVHNGNYNDHQLPQTGFVSLVDTDGVVLQTVVAPVVEFGKDYAITNSNGIFGIIRGGFYGSADDAGIFSQNLAVPLDFKSTGIGFRCVQDIAA